MNSTSLADRRLINALLERLRKMRAEHHQEESELLDQFVEANGRRDDHDTGFLHNAEDCFTCAQTSTLATAATNARK
jgi:hypothetical protein